MPEMSEDPFHAEIEEDIMVPAIKVTPTGRAAVPEPIAKIDDFSRPAEDAESPGTFRASG